MRPRGQQQVKLSKIRSLHDHSLNRAWRKPTTYGAETATYMPTNTVLSGSADSIAPFRVCIKLGTPCAQGINLRKDDSLHSQSPNSHFPFPFAVSLAAIRYCPSAVHSLPTARNFPSLTHAPCEHSLSNSRLEENTSGASMKAREIGPMKQRRRLSP